MPRYKGYKITVETPVYTGARTKFGALLRAIFTIIKVEEQVP